MQKKKYIFILTVISVLLIISISGSVSCKAENKTAQLSGNWNVVMIDDIELNPQDLIKGLPLIKFDTLKGMISGNTGCNDFTGDAVYKENTIEIGDLIATKIACPNMEIEDRFFKILNKQIVTFIFDGDALILTNDTGARLTLISLP